MSKLTADEKVRFFQKGLNDEILLAEYCYCVGITPNLFQRWSMVLLGAEKNRQVYDIGNDALNIRENTEYRERICWASSILNVEPGAKDLNRKILDKVDDFVAFLNRNTRHKRVWAP